ncbi:MAG TPA: g-type lysozyme inhibitor [Stenotrophomonas sp.]
MKHVVAVLALACLLIGLAMSASGADQVTTVPVHFDRGGSSASLKGHFAGYDSVHYTLDARAGQALTVKLDGNSHASFNVFKPGDDPGDAMALANGSVGQGWTGELPTSGEYVVQVYQMRASARRGDKVDFNIGLAVR